MSVEMILGTWILDHQQTIFLYPICCLTCDLHAGSVRTAHLAKPVFLDAPYLSDCFFSGLTDSSS